MFRVFVLATTLAAFETFKLLRDAFFLPTWLAVSIVSAELLEWTALGVIDNAPPPRDYMGLLSVEDKVRVMHVSFLNVTVRLHLCVLVSFKC